VQKSRILQIVLRAWPRPQHSSRDELGRVESGIKSRQPQHNDTINAAGVARNRSRFSVEAGKQYGSMRKSRCGKYGTILKRMWHAAALPLVVWYLLVPPLIEPSPLSGSLPLMDYKEPMFKWKIEQKFDHYDDCSHSLHEKVSQVWAQYTPMHVPTNTSKADADQSRSSVLLGWFSAECVANDDPRLTATPTPTP
jgi:hypothetical protein